MATVITFGEVMMRLTPFADERFSQAASMHTTYGGSEANIAAALAQWNVSAAHAGLFPDHAIGHAAIHHLRKFGMDVTHCQVGEGRLGIYFLEPGSSIRSPKIIYDRSDSAFAKQQADQFDWETILKDANWFHWSGITPAVSENAARSCKKAIEIARQKGITVSGDINYRRNLWQYGKQPLDVMPELISMTDIVVGGLEDFKNCADVVENDFEKGCKALRQKFPVIRKIATTFRETASASDQSIHGVIYNGKELLTTRAFRVNPIVDRIGAGDAFMAGLIYGLLNNKADQAIIDFATASGAFKHTVPGDILSSTLDEIQDLVNEKNVGKLLR